MEYPGNDFENRWVFSRWRNVDNNSADVTAEGNALSDPLHAWGQVYSRLVTIKSISCSILERFSLANVMHCSAIAIVRYVRQSDRLSHARIATKLNCINMKTRRYSPVCVMATVNNSDEQIKYMSLLCCKPIY